MNRPQPLLLIVNPGSTSTKFAVFRGKQRLVDENLGHDAKTLRRFTKVAGQQACRENAIRRALAARGFAANAFDMVVGRGGLLRPVAGGVYLVNATMLDDLAQARFGEHASNLGAPIACAFAHAAGHARAYVADPVVTDELSDVARLTGLPGIERRSVFHALNQKAVARLVATRLGKPVTRCRLIVAHVGGGVSIGVHRNGRVTDVNNALDGEGPFTPERAGGLPLMPFFRLAQEQGLSDAAAAALISRQGGLLAHLGTNDCRKIVARIRAGDAQARRVLEAFVYQLAKAIGAAAAAMDGQVDAIVLTGNVMKSGWILARLRRKIRFIAPVRVVTGNSEIDALAAAGLGVWLKTRRVAKY